MKRKNETLIDFCFIREVQGGFKEEVDGWLLNVFGHQLLHWYIEESVRKGAEMVVAEIRGLSTWQTEQEILHELDTKGGALFWNTIQGCRLQVFSAQKGCGGCENH
jgi:hypothetical protein